MHGGAISPDRILSDVERLEGGTLPMIQRRLLCLQSIATKVLIAACISQFAYIMACTASLADDQPAPIATGEVETLLWSFEDKLAAVSNTTKILLEPLSSSVTGIFPMNDDTPGEFIYDPLTRKSRHNRHSVSFSESHESSRPLVYELPRSLWEKASRGFTLECFIHPADEAGNNALICGFPGAEKSSSQLALEWNWNPNHHVTFHGFGYRMPDGRQERFPVGHYLSSSRLQREKNPWRHLALVYDREASMLTCWIDYHLSKSIEVKGSPIPSLGNFYIGGSQDRWGLHGKIDEVRLVSKALDPSHFQRARKDAIEAVDFVSTQNIVPADSGCYDVKRHFGAAGDGRTDDTAAINAAFAHLADKVPLARNTLVFPEGVYLVSDMLYCSRFIDIKGAGPDKTILRLKDQVFINQDSPKPVLRMSSTSGAPGSHPWVNGSSIALYLEGMTIDTGKGNPGAKGLEYHSNNLGRLEHIVISSGDGSGLVGLDLTHHDVGPALAKHVSISGFDVGVAINYQEYSHTFEHLTLRNQRVVGIRNRGNIVAIRGLKSENQVPAIETVGANSMVTLLDSELMGGSNSANAIESAGALYACRVRTSGYRHAVHQQGLSKPPVEYAEQTVEGPWIEELTGQKVVQGFGHPAGSLRLKIEETPDPELPPTKEWVNLLRYAHRVVDDNWSLALQAAVDDGARVVYLPANERFQWKTPVNLHAPLDRIVGFGHEIGWHPKVWSRAGDYEQTNAQAAPPPLLIYDEQQAGHTLVFDRLECQHLQHASPATLVLRSSSPGRYSTTTGGSGGKLFAEDVGGADWHFDHPQSVWVRQWNPESHAAGPCIHSRGATIWSLGFKTEYESQKLLAEAGAKTEILGAFIYPIGKIPEERPVFENRDSQLSLIYGLSVYQSNHAVQIIDQQGSDQRLVKNEALLWVGSRGRMDLYTSSGQVLPK